MGLGFEAGFSREGPGGFGGGGVEGVAEELGTGLLGERSVHYIYKINRLGVILLIILESFGEWDNK